jgi:hypothetical protein
VAFVLVQELVVTWTKDERGGKAATERNALPEAVPIPSFDTSAYPLALVHDKVTFYAGMQHHLTVEEYPPHPKPNFGCIWIAIDPATVSVTYAYNRLFGGAPERTAYPRTVLTLGLGTWGRISYNGRFSERIGNRDGGAWFYKKMVFNIGYFDSPNYKIFLAEPHHIFDDMADLW